MRKGSTWGLIVTGILIVAVSAGTAALSFFMWALALNGFMGQEQAVNVSLIVFVVLIVVTSLACLGLSLFVVHYLANRRNWNAAGSAALSAALFSVALIVLHLLSIFISVAVASQLRTTR